MDQPQNLENPSDVFDPFCTSIGPVQMKSEPVENITIKLEDLHHSTDIQDEDASIYEGQRGQQAACAYPFVCPTCFKGHAREDNFTRHLEIHKIRPFVYPTDSEENAAEQISESHLPFVCPTCYKEFTLKHDFEGHLKTHTSNETFTCEICYKRFQESQRFQTHLKIHKPVDG